MTAQTQTFNSREELVAAVIVAQNEALAYHCNGKGRTPAARAASQRRDALEGQLIALDTAAQEAAAADAVITGVKPEWMKPRATVIREQIAQIKPVRDNAFLVGDAAGFARMNREVERLYSELDNLKGGLR